MKNSKIIEPFGLANTTNVNMDVKNERSLQNSLNLNNEQISNCISNFVNNVSNDIEIDNSVVSSFTAVAKNKIVISNIRGCDVINIGNIKQATMVNVKNETDLVSEKKVAIETSIHNTIKTKIEQSQNTDELIDKATKAQQGAMESFLKGSDVDYEALGKMAKQAAKGASSSGIGNTANVDIDFSQSTDVETALGISSKQINDVQNNSTNDLSTKIKNSNSADINTVLKADNMFKVSKISECKELNINKISQTAEINAEIKNFIKDIVDVEVKGQFQTNVDNLFSSCWSGLKEKNTQEAFEEHNKGKTPSDPNYVTEEEYAAGLDAIANNLEAVELQMYLSMLNNQTNDDMKPVGDIRDKLIARLEAIANGDTTGCSGTNPNTELSDMCVTAEEKEKIINKNKPKSDPTGPDTTGPDTTGPDTTGPDTPGPDTTEPTETGGGTSFSLSSLLKPPYNYIIMGVCVLIILLIILSSVGGSKSKGRGRPRPRPEPRYEEPSYDDYDDYDDYDY